MAKIDKLIEKYKVQARSANTLLKIDPSKNGKYLEWLFKMKFTLVGEKYRVNPSFTPSVAKSVYGMLTWLEKNSNNKNLPKEYKDINNFTSPSDMFLKLEDYMNPTKTQIKTQIDKIYEDDTYLVLIPRSYEASQLYGYGTRWCTTMKSYYNSYTKNGILIYMINKKTGRKFGLPIRIYDTLFELKFGQYKYYNNEDVPVTWFDVCEVFGDFNEAGQAIVDYYNTNYGEKLRNKYKYTILNRFVNDLSKYNKEINKIDKDVELANFQEFINKITNEANEIIKEEKAK